MYEGIIARITNKQPIKGADFIVSADVTVHKQVIASVVTGIDTPDNTLGIYFCADIQLSPEYCVANNLLVQYNEDGSKVAGSGYLDPDKRRIKTQKFKGVKSDGLWMPLISLNGFHSVIDVVACSEEGYKLGEPIAKRYPKPEVAVRINKQGKQKSVTVLNFPEHYDTDQFRYNYTEIERMPIGLPLWITEKLHGTSHRVGNVPVIKELSKFKRAVNWLFRREVFATTEYKLVHGTRRVVLDTDQVGYYGSNQFRYDAIGEVTLPKERILYGEIVGYVGTNPIMPAHSTKDFKEAKQRFGDTFLYDYGLEQGQAKFIVYRITDNGKDLTIPECLTACDEYGYDFVPILTGYTWDGNLDTLIRFVENTTQDIMKSTLADHPAEGICIRIGDRTWKHKTFMFKVMEGILEAPTLEDQS